MAELTHEDAQFLEQARREFGTARTAEEVESLRVKYLGRRQGLVQARFDSLRSARAEERRRLGASANALKEAVEQELAAAQARVGRGGRSSERPIDATLPGLRPGTGRRHVLVRTLERLVDVAATLGFSVAEGPEVETEEYNFDALNIPSEHPSHDSFDTFYLDVASLDGGSLPEAARPGVRRLLRSHTSPVQVREMRKRTGWRRDWRRADLKDAPPLRVVAPGRVYRPDAVDARHYHTFHQIEGLAVDRDITFLDLKHTLHLFMKGLLGEGVSVRFRPSFFPFTEPSAEMDVSCPFCGESGRCAVCHGSGWIELLGCGMVHPRVLEAGGYDPERVVGFAFGMGIERLAMARHGIDDIRLFCDAERGNLLGFLEQF